MNLKPNNIFVDRRDIEDRRTTDKSLWVKTVERRKRPDRRLDGLDVEIIDVNEEDFIQMFSLFLSGPNTI